MDTFQTLDADAITTVGNEARQFLTFLLDNAEYGVDILRVQEIKGWDRNAVTSLPNTPEYVRGVINLRGTIVPLVDM
jgi:purine-binding chemotaxis protein CheW